MGARAWRSWPSPDEVRELARALGAAPAFSACRQVELEALVRAGRVTSLPASWTLLHERTPADACYLLLEGEVRIVVGGVQLAVLGPGAVLGEMGLLGRRLRTASAVTSTPVRALRIDYDDLVALLRNQPGLSVCLGAVYDEHQAADGGRAGSRAREAVDV